jgi:hypothetical protein
MPESDDAYILEVTCDVNARKFSLLSSEGDEKFVDCETPEEFMNVWNFVHAMLSEDEITYAPLLTVEV